MSAPDMRKVRAALERYGPHPVRAADWRDITPKRDSTIPQDAAIRKPLKSHGNPCRGWTCSHFLHDDR